MTRFYEVIVGNIGKVHKGANRADAEKVFTLYKFTSKENVGRGAGESVSLWADGEPIEEYTGTLDEATMSLEYGIAVKEMLKGRLLKRQDWEYNKYVGYDPVQTTLYIVDHNDDKRKFVPMSEERQAHDWMYADLKLPE